jgi:glycosyltransferase involved in cell wall biosynthesis
MLPTKSKALAVLQVIPELETGGAERTAVDVAAAVVRAGGRSWIATEGGRLAAEARAAGIQICQGPYASKNPFVVWRNAARLALLAKQNGIDIIHARSRAPGWSSLLAAQRARVPFVATYHGIYNVGGSAKRLYNSVMARADAVIANSQFTADHVLAEHSVVPSRLYVIPRGIDVDRFAPDKVPAERIAALRRQWQVEADRKVILLPGRLTRWKGQLVFIDALARMRSKDVLAVLAGDAQDRDTYVDDLRSAIEREGLSERVRITGHCDDIPAAMMASDVVVAPSIEPEAFGRIAVEAQAMGRPLVASALGAQRETVEDGVTGFLVPPNDSTALAAAMDRALSLDAETRKAMALAGRARVLARYTVDAMTAATLDIYRKLVAHG